MCCNYMYVFWFKYKPLHNPSRQFKCRSNWYVIEGNPGGVHASNRLLLQPNLPTFRLEFAACDCTAPVKCFSRAVTFRHILNTPPGLFLQVGFQNALPWWWNHIYIHSMPSELNASMYICVSSLQTVVALETGDMFLARAGQLHANHVVVMVVEEICGHTPAEPMTA